MSQSVATKTAVDEAPVLRGGLGQVILATVASTAGFWAWMSIAPLQNIYAEQMGLDQGQISLMLATPVLVGALGRIVVGAMTDRFGGRRMFTLVLLASVPAVLLMAPTAYHRLTFRYQQKRKLVFYSNRFAIAGLVFLALAILGALTFVTDYLFSTAATAVVAGLAAMLEPHADRVQVVEVESGSSVVRDVDVVLHDTFACPDCLADHPDTSARVVVFTFTESPEAVAAARAAGVIGATGPPPGS